MSEKENTHLNNYFKTKDEVIRKTKFNNKIIEIINLCEKNLKSKR